MKKERDMLRDMTSFHILMLQRFVTQVKHEISMQMGNKPNAHYLRVFFVKGVDLVAAGTWCIAEADWRTRLDTDIHCMGSNEFE
jgi:hypothetical protein